MINIYKIALVTSFILLIGTIQAQDKKEQSIGLSFQKIDVGRGLQLNYNRQLSENWWGSAGLYFHFNALPFDDQAFAYHNRAWANKWYEHLGLGLSINRNVISYKDTRAFLYYNVHLLHISYRTRDYYGLWDQANNRSVYILNEGYIYGPLWTWENAIGAGVKTMLGEHLGFTIRGGLGINIVYDPYAMSYSWWPKKLFGTDEWQGMAMFSTGLFYKL